MFITDPFKTDQVRNGPVHIDPFTCALEGENGTKVPWILKFDIFLLTFC